MIKYTEQRKKKKQEEKKEKISHEKKSLHSFFLHFSLNISLFRSLSSRLNVLIPNFSDY